MNLVVLGSSSGMLSEYRGSPAFWLESDNESILMDCGDGCAKTIKALNLNIHKIRGVVISHFHPDHWAGLSLFVHLMHHSSPSRSIKIALPAEGFDFVQKLLEHCYMWPERINVKIEWIPLIHKQAVKIGNFEIKPWLNTHLDGYRGSAELHPDCKLESFSLQIFGDNKEGVYSGDIGSLSDLEPLMTKDLDWLLLEGMHYNIHELEPWLHKFDPQRVFITHIPPEREDAKFPDYTMKLWDGLVLKF